MKIETTFAAVDADGCEYIIAVCRGEHDISSMRQRNAAAPDALAELQTLDGYPVRRIERGVYDIDTDAGTSRVTSTDPDAP